MAITGYYGLIDLGLRSGVTQYITRYFACRDYERLNRSASTGFVVLAFCGAFLAVISVILALIASQLFRLPEGIENEVAWCILIVGGGTALQFCLFPFAAVFVATQRYDLANAIGVFTRILTAVSVCVALSLGYGLVTLSGLTTAGNIVDYLIRYRVAKRILPQLRISPRRFDRSRVREFWAYGIWAFTSQSAVQIAQSSSPVIIGLMLPVAAIGRFGLAMTVVTFFQNLLAPAVRVFFPVTTHLDAAGDVVGLRRIYTMGTCYLSLAAIVFGFVGSLFADEFFTLWIGGGRVRDQLGDLPAIFRLLLIGSGLWISQYMSTQILLGRRQVALLARISIGYSAMYLVTSVFLTYRFGLMGAALAITITSIVFQAFIVPYLCCRSLQLRSLSYAREAYLRPFVFIGLLLPCHWLKDAYLPATSSWITLIWYGFITFVLVAAAALAIVLTHAERVRIFGKLANLIPLGMADRRLASGTRGESKDKRHLSPLSQAEVESR